MRPEEIYRGETTRHWREGDSRCCLVDRPRLIEMARQCLFEGLGEALDLGCGTGRWTSQLAPYAAAVTGIDRSPEMLAVARERYQDSGVRFMEEDIFSLGTLFRPGSLTLVTGMMCLQYVSSAARLQELYGQINRVLEPGGHFLALVPNPLGMVSGCSKWAKTTLPAGFDPQRSQWIEAELRNTSGVWTKVGLYYHPAAVYLDGLVAVGLEVEQVEEPVAGPEHRQLHPDLGDDVPLGLIIKARKP